MSLIRIGFILMIVFFLFVVITYPLQRDNIQYGRAYTKELKEGLDMIDRICNSGCKDSENWIPIDKKLEAENYCLRQCSDKGNMKQQAKDIYVEMRGYEFRSQYHKIIAMIHCVAGFYCLPAEIRKLH